LARRICHTSELGSTMAKDFKIEFEVELLQECILVVVPKLRKNSKPKPMPVNLTYDEHSNSFRISDAKHAEKVSSIPAIGNWPKLVQVDGRKLHTFIFRCESNKSILLSVDGEALNLKYGTSSMQLIRLDGRGKKGIKTKPRPPDPRHTGPIVHPPDPVGKRVELNDTWLFSARVPVPQHRRNEETDLDASKKITPKILLQKKSDKPGG
jgi:hypothetical protein